MVKVREIAPTCSRHRTASCLGVQTARSGWSVTCAGRRQWGSHTILEQLAADRAREGSRIPGTRRRYQATDLHRAFLVLTDLAYEGPWTREDLIQLVDAALAEAAAQHAEDAF